MTSAGAQRILTAVQDILVERGLEDVTIRNVAAAAGLSIGAVQHHHKTKDDLIMAAMNEVSRNFIERVASAVHPEASARQNLGAVCRILGGVDDESRTASVIWLSYASKATTSSAVASAHQASWRLMEEGLTTLLRQWNPDLAEDDAAMLMALLDGLAIARVTETDRMTSERAQRLIDQHLKGLEPPSR
ncbi:MULTISPECIES: TetR/AcrR family transcriptional regulator [unclassified Arthrobacter]|uniref:TetR/AcrR family transcriptional regulator n=1 Tax=unclassified Arthrobacter TaxID=235627 RepID=UPI001D14E3C5|nr:MULTISPECIES: TetR/AcrR family transcriptional regulator [unclassified Arthrobacter]MCC3276224.1 TetR/AcrR family transcriptional regulator [Arthrobacter sp. zg-Y20]MCC9178738.1 TetR/AcrR family transcriptional regulator [Arthrobacter sp. zg-Y750]WIB06431.1 TetR/AcrR family transcriptional regulator [Arthrobacter sp. zg-Y20]